MSRTGSTITYTITIVNPRDKEGAILVPDTRAGDVALQTGRNIFFAESMLRALSESFHAERVSLSLALTAEKPA